jgi:hypothetical protein
MDNATGTGTATLAAFLETQGSFLLSIVVGMAVIAFYARKRIEELIHPPKGEEYLFTRSLPIDAIVGESNFYKSYVIYVLLLEFLYFFICSSKPLVLLLASDTTGATFQGAAWPLGAALLVVGLLPSTPIVAQIETMLRGLAQRVANVPSEFFNRVTKLSRSEVETLFAKTPDYKPEMRKYRQIHNILVCLDFPPDDAMLMARSCVSADLFAQWTIGGARIWSSGEYETYRTIIADLRPKVGEVLALTDSLVDESNHLPAIQDMMTAYGITAASNALTMDEFDARQADIDKVKHQRDPTTRDAVDKLVTRWRSLILECDLTARKLCALFAIIARSDKEATRRLKSGGANGENGASPAVRRSDPVLREILMILDDHTDEPEPWSEAATIAALGGFVACIICLAIYLYAIDRAALYFFPVDKPDLATVTEAMKSSLVTTLALGFSFGFASIVALFLRSMKIEEGSWIYFRSFRSFPVSNYFGILAWCSMAAFMPLVISYIAYYYTSDAGVEQITKLKPPDVLSTLFFRFLFGFTAVTYGIGTCVIADIVNTDNKRKTARVLAGTAVAIAFICFIVLIATPGYDVPTRIFWHNMVAVCIYTTIALAIFFLSFRSYPGSVLSPQVARGEGDGI